TNLVFMGMGEPLLNYAHTVTAIRIITDSLGLNISPRRITVSTCGIAYKIVQFGHELSVNLAISLNAPSDELRSYLMPVNKKYPLSVLIEACKKFPLQKRKRITFEYIMLSGINDTQSHAQELLHTIRGIRCKVNLIPFNEYYGSEFKQSHSKTIKKFQEVLMDGHITASIRKSRGADIMASCGQLTFKNV
ncbi:MAG: 23S rRNA (adenine(2503)-C(2))-methyltransferase RlmN, partial [Thermodesulfobacteriota bacterium]|nr:23S rRNA (adenine(2503)-C(2))-methyltransferase RlmN [Thermodesulfobacteriota bacterium]